MLDVKLVAHTPEPEKIIAAAAKMCYSASRASEILDGLDEEKTVNFLKMLTEIGHESPIEHASFTFAVEGVSRSLLAQITRHRIASFSVQSQRYVKEDSFSYITPSEIERDEKAKSVFLKAMEDDRKAYSKLTEILYKKHYDELVSCGKNEEDARRNAEKKAIEDARYVLSNACETKIMLTMNARSLYNFFKLRCCNRAQWEIRELAWKMLALCLEVAPVLFSRAGPSCLHGVCSEGKMTCGKAHTAKEKYKNLF